MCAERSMKLLYQSDFTESSKQWGEWRNEKSRGFRRDGYYHIGAKQTVATRGVGIPIADFKASVDAQFTDYNDEAALYGIVFRGAEETGRLKFYLFGVHCFGRCALYLKAPDKWIEIVGYKRYDFGGCQFIIALRGPTTY